MASIDRRGAGWRARIRIGGNNIARTFDTRAQAEAWATKQEERLKSEPKQVVKVWSAEPTVAELFARYAEQISPTRRGEKFEVIRLRRLTKEFGALKATELDAVRLAEWRDLRLQSVSAYAVNRDLDVISAVYTRAIKEWRLPLPISPVRTMVRPAMPKPRKRRVSDAERAKLLDQLGWDGVSRPVNTRQLTAWVFCVALETMMRQGEIIGITWQHVHLDKRFVHLPKTKNGETRDVPLSSRALALFNMMPRGKDGQRVAAINQGTLGLYFRRAVKAAGLADLHFHDSRREALTNAAKKLTNPADLSRASGHSHFRTLMVYYRPDVEDLASKLD